MGDLDSYLTEENLVVDDAALDLVPRHMAERLVCLPMVIQRGTIRVAMANPDDLLAVDQLTRVTRLKVTPVRATSALIHNAISRHYPPDEVVTTGPRVAAPGLAVLGGDGATLLESVDTPAVGLVSEMLEAAIADRASDVHIEPQANRLYVRFRVDGVLYDYRVLPTELHSSIISRLKVMSTLDIAEHRLPQDGRFDGKLGDRLFDVRVSTVPGMFGEKMVLRLLPKAGAALALTELGFAPRDLRAVEDYIQRPHGMFLATGPTGSGKTTTLYAALSRVDRVSKNVVTIEDPVEYQLPRVTQIQVRPKVDLTFANGLRSILRQDPDIIMVGEIRDGDTLRMAIQAALTGHLVFTTVHANDAAGVTTRLVDMGAEPFLVASAVGLVVAQRLVRRICAHCKAEDHPPAAVLEELGITEGRFHRGTGCHRCRGTGYHGRISVFEVLRVDDVIGGAIVRRESAGDVRRLGRSLNLPNLRDDGIEKARQGVTTLEEVLRAVYVEE